MFNIENANSPKYVTADNSIIELNVKFACFNNFLPFGASADDVEPHGRELYARAINGEFGQIAPYVPPVAEKPQPSVSGAQTL